MRFSWIQKNDSNVYKLVIKPSDVMNIEAIPALRELEIKANNSDKTSDKLLYLLELVRLIEEYGNKPR